MITDYTQLKSSIGSWLHRGDLEGVAPDLIALAEVRFNRNLRVRQMEKRVTLTAAQSTPLPADWIEFIGQPTLGETPLDYITRDQYKTACGNYYTIIGSDIWLAPVIDGTPTLTLDYYTKIPALSDQAPANWLLADGVDLYLYGSLLEAEPYMKNDTRIDTWRGLLQVAITDLQASSDRAKYSGGSLVIR